MRVKISFSYPKQFDHTFIAYVNVQYLQDTCKLNKTLVIRLTSKDLFGRIESINKIIVYVMLRKFNHAQAVSKLIELKPFDSVIQFCQTN